MLLDGARTRLLRGTLVVMALAGSGVFLVRSFGGGPVTSQPPEQRLETAELNRQAAAAHTEVVVARAQRATAATKPSIARVESLRMRVVIQDSGQLLVQDPRAVVKTLVTVPPLVIHRMEADSAAIHALTQALTSETQASAALEERLVAEAKVREAARLTITELEHERRPRCGRRCGMLLGAAAIVALGVVVDQTHRLLYH